MHRRASMIMAAMVVAGLSPAWGAGRATPDGMSDHPMGSSTTAGMDHGSMIGGTATAEDTRMEDMKGMEGMARGVTPPEPASGALRDPHAYADGYDFGPIPPPRMADQQSFGSLRVDRLERVDTSHHGSAAYDLQAWYGRDYDRAVVKAEGDIDRNKVQQGRAEFLWGHAVTPFWDSQLGVRQDHGARPGRGWLAAGFQGLSAYWFELNVTAYFSRGGRSALRLDGEYELLLTQRLILQPRVEMNIYGKADADRAVGAGLANTAAGLRLRYEIRREFAPYAGIEWAAKYGGTAAFARAAGEARHDTRLVAGLRFWF